MSVLIYDMKVICIYMLHDSLDTVASEFFWPRPNSFWPRPRPWPHTSLASLTSLSRSSYAFTHLPIQSTSLEMHLISASMSLGSGQQANRRQDNEFYGGQGRN